MPRLMSVALTTQGVRERRKTVTRRLGWWRDRRGRLILSPGDHLTLCPKVQGRRRPDGTVEPLVRLAEVQVISVRRERLWCITDADILREAVDRTDWAEVYEEHEDPRMVGQPTPQAWVWWYCEAFGCDPHTEVTRIEWRYLDEEVAGG